MLFSFAFFFFTDPATTEIYTLSLHDALPISCGGRPAVKGREARAAVDPDFGLRVALGFELADHHAVKAREDAPVEDRKSTRLNSSHLGISYAVFCLKKKT